MCFLCFNILFMKIMLIRCVSRWFRMSFVQNAFSRILFGVRRVMAHENMKVPVFYHSTNVFALSQTRHRDARKTGKTKNLWFHTLNRISDPSQPTRRRKEIVYIGKHAQYTAFNYTYRCGEVVINSQKNKLPLSWKHNWMTLEVERSTVQ